MCVSASAASFEELRKRAELVQREYDLPLAEALMGELQLFVKENPGDEPRMTLARVALLVAELRRMEYETTDIDPREKRLLGRTIDEAARIGHEALDKAPNISEKWRIKADLLGTMIRSKYKGNKYGGEMDKATEKALELDPESASAIVTGSKRGLFAKPEQGGDIPAALEMLNRALHIDPDHERALIFRGIAYEKLGNDDLAEEDWKRVLELNPHSRLAKENLRSMNGGTD
jgi:tetratricopeptide (TPR) repeat protein